MPKVQWLVNCVAIREHLTHNQLVPGSSPGGTTNKPSKSLTMRVFVFIDLIVEQMAYIYVTNNQKNIKWKIILCFLE